MGHRVGEYVAACVADVFRLEDRLQLISKRAQLMQSLPAGGSMVVLFASGEQVETQSKAFGDEVVVAAFNGLENTKISGPASAVEQVVAQSQELGVKAQLLTVSHAFHSPLMDPILDEFESFAQQFEFRTPNISIACNLTGVATSNPIFRANYWRQHIRNPVQFAKGVESLTDEQVHAVIEPGPTASLLGMGKRCASQWNVLSTPLLRKGQDDASVVLGALSDLYVLGAKVDWSALDRHAHPQRMVIPSYPFEQQR